MRTELPRGPLAFFLVLLCLLPLGVLTATSSALADGDRSDVARYARELKAMRTGIAGIILAGMDGQLIAAEPSTGLVQDVSSTDWYQVARDRPGGYVSQAFTPTMTKVSRSIVVASQITAPGDGKIIGVLVADPTRRVLALTSLREDPRVSAAPAGHSLFGETMSSGVEVLSASLPVRGSNWTVTVEVPKATALAGAGQLRLRILSLSGLLGVALLAVLLLLIAKSRSRQQAQQVPASQATALKLAHDEAIRASAAKSMFLAKASHELRTPINGVPGMNDLLLGTDLDGEQRRYSSTIRPRPGAGWDWPSAASSSS